jgi:hypothetical protein
MKMACIDCEAKFGCLVDKLNRHSRVCSGKFGFFSMPGSITTNMVPMEVIAAM